MSGSQIHYLAAGDGAYSEIHDPIVESGGEGDLVELDVFGFGLEVSFFRSIGAKKSLPS